MYFRVHHILLCLRFSKNIHLNRFDCDVSVCEDLYQFTFTLLFIECILAKCSNAPLVRSHMQMRTYSPHTHMSGKIQFRTRQDCSTPQSHAPPYAHGCMPVCVLPESLSSVAATQVARVVRASLGSAPLQCAQSHSCRYAAACTYKTVYCVGEINLCPLLRVLECSGLRKSIQPYFVVVLSGPLDLRTLCGFVA